MFILKYKVDIDKTRLGYQVRVYFKNGILLKPLLYIIHHFFKLQDYNKKIISKDNINSKFDPQLIDELNKKEKKGERYKNLIGDMFDE